MPPCEPNYELTKSTEHRVLPPVNQIMNYPNSTELRMMPLCEPNYELTNSTEHRVLPPVNKIMN